jgi:hypothetical protein
MVPVPGSSELNCPATSAGIANAPIADELQVRGSVLELDPNRMHDTNLLLGICEVARSVPIHWQVCLEGPTCARTPTVKFSVLVETCPPDGRRVWILYAALP